MTGQVVRLAGPKQRELAKRLIDAAPDFASVEIKPETRSNAQNSRMWAMLSAIARAKPGGRSMPVDSWKALFCSAAGFKCTFEPSLDGNGVVPLGFKSSRLNKAEFSDLFACIEAFAAENGIDLGEPPIEDYR